SIFQVRQRHDELVFDRGAVREKQLGQRAGRVLHIVEQRGTSCAAAVALVGFVWVLAHRVSFLGSRSGIQSSASRAPPSASRQRRSKPSTAARASKSSGSRWAW